jgi:hypothetical protein
VSARVQAFEDPRDVYRVWLPARKNVTVRVRSAGVAVTLGGVSRAGKTFSLTVRNTQKTGRNAFLTVKPQTGVRDSTYSLTLSAG